jgi:hypothetical protein
MDTFYVKGKSYLLPRQNPNPSNHTEYEKYLRPQYEQTRVVQVVDWTWLVTVSPWTHFTSRGSLICSLAKNQILAITKNMRCTWDLNMSKPMLCKCVLSMGTSVSSVGASKQSNTVTIVRTLPLSWALHQIQMTFPSDGTSPTMQHT